MRLRIGGLLALVGLLLAGCTVATEPLAFGPAPWQDGETSEYDIVDAGGVSLGSATWEWRAAPEGWEQRWLVQVGERGDQGVVFLGPDLYPLRSQFVAGGATYGADYGPMRLTLTTTPAEGEAATKTYPRPEHPIDNDQSLQIHRALPLAEGYATRYTDVIPTTSLMASTLVRVTGVETVTVPAGTFEAWRVAMTAGGSTHDAWYTVEPPHLMVKYHNRNAGSQFVLRRWKPNAGAPWAAATDAGEAPPAVPDAPASGPDWLRVGVAFGVQYPLMILLPLGLGWWVRRRYGVGWRVFAIGAATFVLSQVVHLPLNWALGLLGPGGRGVALWPLPWLALVAGLTSGVCEEGARWLVLRRWLRETRGWAGALQFGAGHGGVEAIIFGSLAALGMISALAMTLAGQNVPGLAIYWQTPWYEFALAGVERVFALSAHVCLAMLVMRAVMTRRIVYLLAAIAGHCLLNFWAVWGMGQVGMLAVEAGLALMALAAVALVVVWRRQGVLEPADSDA